MYINVFYTNKISFFLVKRRSKKFFLGTKYKQRNCVFSHLDEDSVFSIRKNNIHILIEDNDEGISLANQFLRNVFKDVVIGINLSNKSSISVLNSLNYVLV